MWWRGGRESENVEERGYGPVGWAIGGGGSILLVILGLIFGIPFGGDDDGGNAPGPDGRVAQAPPDPRLEERKHFVKVVLASTEDVWHKIFREQSKTYREPKLVLFHRRVESACGLASSAVGPFYCPEDEHVYLDLDFFRELKERFKSPGDFAQAYVIAHEVGHHVQNLLGRSRAVHAQRAKLGKTEYNKLSVRLELQADFYAGVWAYHADKMRHILEPGDLETAIRAASAIGDDRLQKQARGYVVPDSFTHGTSEQRVRWFRRGFETGDVRKGDTFKLRDDEL